MIEWLMQVVAVAWMGAMLIMLLEVLESGGALPADGRDRDPPRPVGQRHAVGHGPIRGSIDSVPMRSRVRAHRGNARELTELRALADRRGARAVPSGRRR